MHRYLMTSVAAFALGIGAASAADLGRAPAPVYTKAPLAVPFSWTGFYIGPNIGAGYQRIQVEARGPARTRLSVRTRNGYYPGETMR